MTTTYFEIADSVLGRPIRTFDGSYVKPEGKYLFYHRRTSKQKFPNAPMSLMYVSERIWEENEDGVRWIKNRWIGADMPVDLKEFLWVKLASIPFTK
jgi:hypothetical protein